MGNITAGAAMNILGYLVEIAGIILIVIGVFGAAIAVFTDRGKGVISPADTFVAVLKELPKLIDALAKAPKWLSMVLIGLLLVWAGNQLGHGGWPFA